MLEETGVGLQLILVVSICPSQLPPMHQIQVRQERLETKPDLEVVYGIQGFELTVRMGLWGYPTS